ncbi:hypothetical protein D3C73_572290 [compost metagenome]
MQLTVGMQAVGKRAAMQLLPLCSIGDMEHAASRVPLFHIGSNHPPFALFIPQELGAGLVLADDFKTAIVFLTGIFVERNHISANHDLRHIQNSHASADFNPAFGREGSGYGYGTRHIHVPGIINFEYLLTAGSDRKLAVYIHGSIGADCSGPQIARKFSQGSVNIELISLFPILFDGVAQEWLVRIILGSDNNFISFKRFSAYGSGYKLRSVHVSIINLVDAKRSVLIMLQGYTA